MKYSKCELILIFMVVALLSGYNMWAQQYTIQNSTFTSGSSRMSSTSYQAYASTGQLTAGEMSSPSYGSQGGFWIASGFNQELFYMDILANWNLLGLPNDVADKSYQSVFPNALPGTCFGWNGSYYLEDSLELGTGYWLRFPAAETVSIQGNYVDSLTITLMQGWNMISGISGNIALTDVIDPGSIIIPGTLFGYNGAYYLSDSIRQGSGYWLRTSAAGSVILVRGTSSAPNLAKRFGVLADLRPFGAVKISDASGAGQSMHFGVKLDQKTNRTCYSLPPLPPAGAFDIRFSDDSRISETDEMLIRIQTTQYPLTISTTNIPDEKYYRYVLREVLPDGKGKKYVLDAEKSIEVSNPQVKTLKLSKEKIVPLTFRVCQNYPNPFNPTTIIKYALPQSEMVQIVIYNMLGQKVKTLVNKHQEAGYYEVNWNSTNDRGNTVGSGIYFYVVRAGKHHAVKKMALVK